MTVILHQEQIKKVISLDESLIPIIENAFVSLSEGRATTPPIMRLDIPEFHGEADQYSNSHYKYLEPMTLVGVFFLIVSIPSAILAMKLEKKFKRRKI